MKNLTKKLLATFMAGAMLIGAALPVLAAEDGEPCAHEGMASDSSYCSDCDTYYIKKQPISSDGYVSVYDINNVESYQWYGYSEYELITDKTVYPRGNEKGEVSVYENGVWTPVLTENGNSNDRYSTFTFDELNSGDVVLINAYVILESGYVYKLGAGDFEFENFHYGFTGSETYRNFSVAAELRGHAFDVTPTIRVNNSVAMGQDYELKIVAYRYDSVKAAGKLEKAMEADPELLPRDAYYSFYTAVEGQNSFMLTNGENSRNYFCRVTFKDGTVIDTDTILYSHKISKVPIAAAPSIKVTSGDDASYQWYRESYEVSLLSAGEGIYSYTLTPDKAERPIDISDSGEDNEGGDSENTPDDPEGSQGGDIPAGDAPATAPEESGEAVTDEPEEASDDTAAGGLGAGAVIAIAIGAAVVGAGVGVGISLGVSAKKTPKSKKTEE